MIDINDVMDTDLLRTFIEVNKTRHFGKAATNLYLTQSAVSFRIRQLEIQLGTPVFTRKRGDLRLTPAGERFMPYAKSMLQTWGQAKQEVALSGHYHALIRVGASALIWELDREGQQISRLRHALPHWAINTQIIESDQSAQTLLEQQNDVIFTMEIPKLAELNHKKIDEIRFFLVSNIRIDDIAFAHEIPLIDLDWGERFGMLKNKISTLQRLPVLHTHSINAALNYLLRYGGIGYLPECFIAEYLATSALFHVPNSQILEVDIHAIWRCNDEKSTVIDNLFSNFEEKVSISLSN